MKQLMKLILPCVIFGAVSLPTNAANYPASDPNNTQGWQVQSALSDEFDGNSLDTTKWYNYHTYWSGRDPSQFSTDNVSVSNGVLVLRTTNLGINLVKGGGFEEGNLTNWSQWGSGSAWTENSWAYYGKGRVGYSGQGAIEQIVQLKPYTTYKLSGWGKCDGSPQLDIGIKNYGGAELDSFITSSDWMSAYQEFTTGPADPTYATVFIYNSGGSGVIHADEISVVPKYITLTPTNNTMTGDNNTTAACVQSVAQGSYGYYECRMQVANGATTSSFWLQNNEPSRQEIDVQEAWTNTSLPPYSYTQMNMNTHWWDSTPTDFPNYGDYNTGVDLTSGYHIYGVDWEPQTITYYFDGAQTRSIPNAHNTDPLSVFLDTEVFTDRAVPLDDMSVNTYVDYVRAWKH